MSIALLCLELSGGSLGLGILGAIMVFFSAFTQWWLSSLSELLLYFSSSCLAFRGIFLADSHLKVSGAALVFFITSVGFALALYPPFQIPLLYVGIAMLPLLLRGSSISPGPRIPFRIASLITVVLIALVAIWMFLRDNQQAAQVLSDTIYPGRRVSLGGDMTVARYFSGVFDQLFSAARFPTEFANICEASSAILLWPLSAILLFFYAPRGTIIASAPMVLFLVISTVWAFYGVPTALAIASLWSYVPTSRAFIGWMVASSFLTVVALASCRKPSRYEGCLLTALVVTSLSAFTTYYFEYSGSRIPMQELSYAAFVVGVLSIGLIWRLRILAMGAAVCACLIPHGMVNPIMSGMEIFSKSELVRAIERFDKSKNGLWAVFGSALDAQLVKVSGRKVINGSQYFPNIELLKKLDPSGEFAHVYNRYAHVTYTMGITGAEPSFTLLAPDSWRLRVDPCHEKFAAIGVDYIVWKPYDSHRRFSCLERVFIWADFAVYKRRAYAPSLDHALSTIP